MSKICTSIEQSKKLIELAVDIGTADMCYRVVAYNPNDTHVYQRNNRFLKYKQTENYEVQ